MLSAGLVNVIFQLLASFITIVLGIAVKDEFVLSQFVLDVNWQVVAGEESKEVEIQNQREVIVLEAVYPRPSAIPSKSDSLYVSKS